MNNDCSTPQPAYEAHHDYAADDTIYLRSQLRGGDVWRCDEDRDLH